MKEAYVSFEIAKLLKEKGFDEPCYMSYWLRTKDNIELAHLEQHYNNYSDCICAPTHQMACAWLREKHLIHVYADYNAFFQEKKPKKWYYHWMPFVKTLPHCPINKSGFQKDTISLDVYCNTYEEAVGAACLWALKNLI